MLQRIAGLAIATACTGGAAAVVFGAALSGAISGGVSGAVMGAIGGGISGGWQGALDGACSGFMSGTLIGGVTGAASAGLNIATGATTVVGNAHGSTYTGLQQIWKQVKWLHLDSIHELA